MQSHVSSNKLYKHDLNLQHALIATSEKIQFLLIKNY